MKTKIGFVLLCGVMGLSCAGSKQGSEASTPAGGASLAAEATQPPNAPSPAAGRVWIRKSDGSLSCEAGSGQSLEEGAQELRAAGVPIHKSKKTNDGQLHIQMCGAPTGSENAYLIDAPKLALAQSKGYRLSETAP